METNHLLNLAKSLINHLRKANLGYGIEDPLKRLEWWIDQYKLGKLQS